MPSVHRTWPTFLLTVLVAGCVADEPTGPVGATGQAIVDGDLDTSSLSVVAITSPQHPLGTFCTGTVVTPTVVLTAAHCVEGAEANDAEVFVYAGSDVDGGDGESIAVIDAAWDDRWSRFQSSSDHDVGVLRLERPIDAPAVPIGPGPGVGTSVTLIGFGFDTVDETGIGVRRRSTGEVTEQTPGDFRVEGARSCDGDSGGPILVEDAGGPVLVGVHSQGNCGDWGREARIDRVLEDFVLPFLGEFATCGADGECALDCADVDPDCPCQPDGHCGASCPDASDRDCDPACFEVGVCGADCPAPDPDCDGAGGADATGSTTSAGGGGGNAGGPQAVDDDRADSPSDEGGCAIAEAGGVPSSVPATRGLQAALLLCALAFTRRHGRGGPGSGPITPARTAPRGRSW